MSIKEERVYADKINENTDNIYDWTQNEMDTLDKKPGEYLKKNVQNKW